MEFKVTPAQLATMVKGLSDITTATVTTQTPLNHLVVTIKRMGTSTIDFLISANPDGTENLTLVSQDISWMHQVFIPQIKSMICNMVIAAGGTVLEV